MAVERITGEQRQVQHALGRLDAQEGAGVHLARQRQTQRVVQGALGVHLAPSLLAGCKAGGRVSIDPAPSQL